MGVMPVSAFAIIGSHNSTSTQLDSRSSATKRSAEAVEVTTCSTAKSNRSVNSVEVRTNKREAPFVFFTRLTVKAFESFDTGTSANRASERNVTNSARPNSESKLTSGFTNTALNSDVKVPLITGESKVAA
ncbi:hypothetical protein KUL113_38160 [Tenacibaculum sp. KUL113]|nr:hypothetical protein KUL113_38160 [Tenacibaculum sp. KUL113]